MDLLIKLQGNTVKDKFNKKDNKIEWNFNENDPIILNFSYIKDIIDIRIKKLIDKQTKTCNCIDDLLRDLSEE